MTNEEKARKLAEDFCSCAGESYDDIMEDYDPQGEGLPDDHTSGVFNAYDIDSLESSVISLLEECQIEIIAKMMSKQKMTKTIPDTHHINNPVHTKLQEVIFELFNNKNVRIPMGGSDSDNGGDEEIEYITLGELAEQLCEVEYDVFGVEGES